VRCRCRCKNSHSAERKLPLLNELACRGSPQGKGPMFVSTVARPMSISGYEEILRAL
jgi:hypothetical protein